VARFLVVEDHALVRHGLVKILSERFPDAEFAEASNAAHALTLLREGTWDIALVDLNLPGRDGLALLEDLKELTPSLPALVVSAYPEAEFAVRCLQVGARGYLTKDSAPEELAVAAAKVLSGGTYVTAALAQKLASIVGGALPAAPHDLLSPREMQVLRLLVTGRSKRQIGCELHLSEKTIATYRRRIGEKLRISTNVELTGYALRHKLVDDAELARGRHG
jgi:two-component system invasion response regulator UvrY